MWAEGAWAEGAWAEGAWATAAVEDPPAAIADLEASSRPNARIRLTWSAAARATGYRLYRGTSTGVTSATGTEVVDTVALSYEDTGLTPESDYYYVVVAYNGIGDAADSNEATAAAGAVVASETSVRRRTRRRYR